MIHATSGRRKRTRGSGGGSGFIRCDVAGRTLAVNSALRRAQAAPTSADPMNAPPVPRRDFLKGSLAAGAVVAFSDFVFSSSAKAAAPGVLPSPSWVDKPMRWAQLTLVEDDPGKFDLQFWLDYFARTKS